jgi:hypothetical protein
MEKSMALIGTEAQSPSPWPTTHKQKTLNCHIQEFQTETHDKSLFSPQLFRSSYRFCCLRQHLYDNIMYTNEKSSQRQPINPFENQVKFSYTCIVRTDYGSEFHRIRKQ